MIALAFSGVGCGDSIALHSTPDASPSIDVAADVNVIAAQTICGQPEQTSAPPAITIATGIGSYPEVIIDSTIVEVFRAGDAAPIATTGVTQHASSTASFSVTVGTNGSPLVGYVRARLGYTYLDGYWFPQSPLAADVSAPDALQLVRRNSDHDFHYAGGPLEPNHSLVVPNYTDCNGK